MAQSRPIDLQSNDGVPSSLFAVTAVIAATLLFALLKFGERPLLCRVHEAHWTTLAVRSGSRITFGQLAICFRQPLQWRRQRPTEKAPDRRRQFEVIPGGKA
jgi:hypothetical protein